MSTDTARWLCNALELPSLLEAADGHLHANAAASEALGPDTLPPAEPPSRASSQTTLRAVERSAPLSPFERGAALRRLLQAPVEEHVLQSMAERARAGTPDSFVPPQAPLGTRLLAVPEDSQQVRWIVHRGQPESQATASLTHVDLAAGVSHELSNALNAIAGWARLARSGQRVDEALEIIERSADSAWALARHMLKHAAGDAEEPAGVLDASEVVEEAARLAGPSAHAQRVRIRRDVNGELHVQGARPQLWSVIWNLVTNALEAMPHGGTLSLAAKPGEDGVHIVVADDGPGMDEATRARVFERHFTTKAQGSGLGLALVKEAVEALHGDIRLHSRQGEGTRWELVLPYAQAAQSDVSQVSGTQPRSSGVFATGAIPSAHVLVVDDDIGMRELIATALEMRGASVVAVGSAEEALTAEGPFDLALIDMLLPDGNGAGLLAQLRGHDMVYASVLVTGTDATTELPEQARPDAWLRKPFQLEDLFDCVRGVLPSEASAPDEAAQQH